jgi:hypothetical protein
MDSSACSVISPFQIISTNAVWLEEANDVNVMYS